MPAASMCGWSVPARPAGPTGEEEIKGLAQRWAGRGLLAGWASGAESGPLSSVCGASEPAGGPQSWRGPRCRPERGRAEAKGGEKDPSPRLPLGPGLGGRGGSGWSVWGRGSSPVRVAVAPHPPGSQSAASRGRAEDHHSALLAVGKPGRAAPLRGGRGVFWKAGGGGAAASWPPGPVHLTPFTPFPAGPGGQRPPPPGPLMQELGVTHAET